MRKLATVVSVALAMAGILAGCASAPEPVEPPDELYDSAKALRTEIIEYDLSRYAPAEFQAGEAAFQEGELAYQSEAYDGAEEAFTIAVSSYTDVITAGFKAIATARKTDADEQRRRADTLKAAVAVPETYEEALAVYQEAVAASASGDDQRAAELFENAATLFVQAYEEAAEKKRLAEEALGNVDRRVQDLDSSRQSMEERARDELPDSEEAQ